MVKKPGDKWTVSSLGWGVWSRGHTWMKKKLSSPRLRVLFLLSPHFVCLCVSRSLSLSLSSCDVLRVTPFAVRHHYRQREIVLCCIILSSCGLVLTSRWISSDFSFFSFSVSFIVVSSSQGWVCGDGYTM